MTAGRVHSVDLSPHKLDIIRDLMAEKPVRAIAAQYGLAPSCVRRYKQQQLNKYLASGDQVLAIERKRIENKQVAAVRDILMEDVEKIRTTGWDIIQQIMQAAAQGKVEGDFRDVSSIMRELRGNIEVQAKLEQRPGFTPNSPTVNVSNQLIVIPGIQAQAPAALPAEVIDVEFSDS